MDVLEPRIDQKVFGASVETLISWWSKTGPERGALPGHVVPKVGIVLRGSSAPLCAVWSLLSSSSISALRLKLDLAAQLFVSYYSGIRTRNPPKILASTYGRFYGLFSPGSISA